MALCGLPQGVVKKAQPAATSRGSIALRLSSKSVFLDKCRIHFPSEKRVGLWGRHS